MIRQEVTVGLILDRHGYLPASDVAEMAVEILLRLILAQGGGKEHGIVVGRDGDEAFVEGLIIKCRKADAVARVEAVFLVRLFRPGDDVASQQ